MRAPLRLVAALLAYLLAAHGLLGATAGAHRLAMVPDLAALCHGDPTAPAKDHDCRIHCLGAMMGPGAAPPEAVTRPAGAAFNPPRPCEKPAVATILRTGRAHPPTGPPIRS